VGKPPPPEPSAASEPAADEPRARRSRAAAYPGPHQYPFRFIDRAGDDRDHRPVAQLSAGCRLPGRSLTLLVEIMAQGALVVLSDGEGESGPRRTGDAASLRLAGVDDARLHAPVVPGDRVTVDARVEGRYGALTKVRCRLERDGETVAEAGLLLAG
jgi:3-hydroxymyristoyl/3-hydroxydecanoyl-(acyl carrier protein) dehydratase